MQVNQEIKNSLSKLTGIKTSQIKVEVPADESHGDFSANIAMQIASKENKNPKELAEEIKEKLSKDNNLASYISKIEVAGPGFINFWLSDLVLIDSLKKALGDNYGKSEIGKGKTVIVEYSSPNIAKPFSVGHLRSSVIGDAVANFFEAAGYTVLRDNHLGDWGTQFGKQIYAIKTWGDEESIKKSKNPVKKLVELYVRFHKEVEDNPALEDEGREWFKKLEEGDKEARRLWRLCVDLSWKEFTRIYDLLGIKFSEDFESGRGLGESFFEDKMPDVIQELEKKDLLTTGEKGAELVFFEDEKYPPAMILKKDGTTLYHTRDLATDLYRKDTYDPDLIINEVGAEQTLYFRQLFEMEKLLGWFKQGQRVHLAHGLIRLKDKKMSTRKGDVIWLEDIIEEAIKRAKKLGSEDNKTAREVAVGAIKWNDLKRDPITEIVFDWDEILNMEGNSGPYMQYTYARASSVVKKAKKGKSVDVKGLVDSLSIPEDVTEEELQVIRHLSRFEGEIVGVVKNYSPNLMANYLYSLAQKFNTMYSKHKIVGGDNEDFRLVLTKATAKTIKNGLGLLGIKTPATM